MSVAYELKAVNSRHGDDKAGAILSLDPTGKEPVLIDPLDPDAQRLVQARPAAILVYLAEKSHTLLPASGVASTHGKHHAEQNSNQLRPIP